MSGYIRLAYSGSHCAFQVQDFMREQKTRSLEKEMLIAVTGMNRVPN